ncbi:lipid uptake coordinator LucA [soil metagenome]
MRRGIAVSWHALSFLIAAVLFFLFVLPRWWELTGDVSPGVGTTLRILTGALIGLTALPVVFNLIRSRRPEHGTPQLALTMRVWSIVGHVLAGVLIVGAAVSEIWLSLDTAGQWLFGVYGAAAALAVLGAAAFYLAFVAESAPPPPKPLKPKKTAAATEDDVDEPVADDEPVSDDEPVAETEVDQPAEVTVEDTPVDDTADDSAPAAGGRLRNRRPSGKTGGRRGGVAVSED